MDIESSDKNKVRECAKVGEEIPSVVGDFCEKPKCCWRLKQQQKMRTFFFLASNKFGANNFFREIYFPLNLSSALEP